MIRKYKYRLILSSLLILLPMVVGLLLQDRMVQFSLSPWGSGSRSDHWTLGTILGTPLTFLIAHWIILAITWKDQRSKNQKVFSMVFWIMPVVSLYCCAIVYCAACGYDLYQEAIVILPLGLLFLAIGNYLPKCQQNHTIGIRLPWTLGNEENWNRTHRFGGKCWVSGSILVLLSIFLPGMWKLYGSMVVVGAMVLLPTLYSYRIYRQHRKEGVQYPIFSGRNARRGLLFTLALVIFLAVVLFTGNIRYHFSETGFTIDADYYSDLTVSYDSIDSVKLVEGNVSGVRVAGFGSPRLLMGTFRNDILGTYTRYTYGNPEACVILTSGSRFLVLSAKTVPETEELYRQLKAAIS